MLLISVGSRCRSMWFPAFHSRTVPPSTPTAMPRLVLIAIAILAACGRRNASVTSATGGCDPSIKLPPGFCAIVFADSAGPLRHLAVRSNGDVIVGVLNQRREPGGVLVLRDTNRDGHADIEARFGGEGAHGIVLGSDSTLYASTATSVMRYRLTGDVQPGKRVDTVVAGLPALEIGRASCRERV